MEDRHDKCYNCESILSGKQKRFCSKRCKNQVLQSYNSQQSRSLDRKTRLVELKGGQCSKCGYNKNLAALCFHHRDPNQKSMKLDSRKLSNATWESIQREAEKCDLLCHNCHMEIHNPTLILASPPLSRPL